MTLNCLIVDDEPLALDLLESYVSRTPFLHLVAQCDSAVKALSVIEEEPIDLVFLDIQMPELNGLELSRLVGNKVKIIFTTAFEQYALEGFRVDALDYLLKPFNYTEFLRAATKALRWIEMSRAENVSANVPDSIFVKSDYKLIQIQLKDILYIEGLKDYIRIQTEDKEGGILTLMSMKSIEDHLPGAPPARRRVVRYAVLHPPQQDVSLRLTCYTGEKFPAWRAERKSNLPLRACAHQGGRRARVGK